MHKKYGDLHLALMEIYQQFEGMGDDYWFSVMIHFGRITVEFGKRVPGTVLRQRYEIDPKKEGKAVYPMIGHAIHEVFEQFKDYVRRWEAGEVTQNVQA